MSNWTECVLDATISVGDGLFAFCPIVGDVDGEYTIVTGYNHLGTDPPRDMTLVGIVHEDGQEAVERFCEEHAGELEALKQRIEAAG